MPFTALVNNNRINALKLDPNEWVVIKENKELKIQCPECNSEMIAKAGIGYKKRPHFAHIASKPLTTKEMIDKLTCSLRMSESQEHEYLKQYIFDYLHECGEKVDLEVKIGNRRADIVLTEKKKVIEIQLSKQSYNKYIARTQDYEKEGYQCYWLAWKKEPEFEIPIGRIKLSIKEDSDYSENNRQTILEIPKHGRFDVELKIPWEYFNAPTGWILPDITLNNWLDGILIEKIYVDECNYYFGTHWCIDDYCEQKLCNKFKTSKYRILRKLNGSYLESEYLLLTGGFELKDILSYLNGTKQNEKIEEYFIFHLDKLHKETYKVKNNKMTPDIYGYLKYLVNVFHL